MSSRNCFALQGPSLHFSLHFSLTQQCPMPTAYPTVRAELPCMKHTSCSVQFICQQASHANVITPHVINARAWPCDADHLASPSFSLHGSWAWSWAFAFSVCRSHALSVAEGLSCGESPRLQSLTGEELKISFPRHGWHL